MTDMYVKVRLKQGLSTYSEAWVNEKDAKIGKRVLMQFRDKDPSWWTVAQVENSSRISENIIIVANVEFKQVKTV